MLVLSRKEGECIVIRGNIVVTLVRVRGSTVQLGVEAPGDVPVNRKEVHDAITARTLPT